MKLYRVWSWSENPLKLHSVEVVEQPSRYKVAEGRPGLAFDYATLFPKNQIADRWQIGRTPEEAIYLEAKRCRRVIAASEEKAAAARKRLAAVLELNP